MGNAGQWSRAVVLVGATVSSAVFVHWAVTQPALGNAHALRAAFFTLQLAPAATPDPLTPLYQWVTLLLAAATGLGANALALLIEIRTRPAPAIRRLALALSLAALATAWFFFAALHPVYRDALGYGPHLAVNLALNVPAYIAGALAPYFLARFFLDYPRIAPPQEWEGYFRRLHDEEAAAAYEGWRAKVIPESMRRKVSEDGGRLGLQRFVVSWRGVALLVAAGVAAAIGDAVRASSADSNLLVPLQAVAFGTLYVAMLLTMVCGFEGLRYHVRNSIDEDRRRIDWLYATLLVGGLAFIAVSPAWWALLPFVLPSLEAAGLMVSGPVLMLGPFSLTLQLVLLGFVVALALSIFYRGGVDPRLALGRLTVFGVVGLVLGFLFVLLERAVAARAASWLGLAPETGVLIAGAVVAASIAPVRVHAEKWVATLLTRFLPVESLVRGERRLQAIVLSDLTGYTALSARDERQAMLVAALLQRQATLLCQRHEGRVVKTMGDAVLLAFDDARAAAAALAQLHREFPAAAAGLGVEALPVHSGAHLGEVTVTESGDVFGQTVNIAARLQGLASPGQAVVSDAFSRAAAIASTRRLGPRELKNVPHAVECEELALA